jgi:hypothetical protein
MESNHQDDVLQTRSGPADTPNLSFLLDSNQRHLPCKGSALPTELRKVSTAIAFLNRIRATLKTIQGYYLRIKDSLVLPLCPRQGSNL